MSDDQDRRAMRAGIGFVIVLLVCLATWKLWDLRRAKGPSGQIQELVAVSAESAVALWLGSESNEIRYWVGRIGTDGKTAWWRSVLADPLRGGLLVGDGVVLVRYLRDGHLKVAAFTLGGEERWDRVLAKHRGDGFHQQAPLGFVFAGHLYQVVGTEKERALHVVNIATATTEWEQKLEDEPMEVLVRGSQFVLSGLRTTYTGQSGMREVIEQPRSAIKECGAASSVISCGAFGESVVLLMHGQGSAPTLVLSDRDGAARKTTELPLDVSRLVRRTGDSDPYSGSLTRFVPYADHQQLHIFDLEQWTGVSSRIDGSPQWIFREGDHWYIVSFSEVLVLDGRTGRELGTIRGATNVAYRQVRYGRLWVHGYESRIDDAAIAVLDEELRQLYAHDSLKLEVLRANR